MISSTLFAISTTRTTFEFARIQSNSDWILPIVVAVLVFTFVRYMYRRDTKDIKSPMLGWLLTTLRATAFLGLLLLYLQPQWRSEREIVENSQAVLLIDTSLSMGLRDGTNPRVANRAQHVAESLKSSDILKQLRKTHDVLVFSFDKEIGQIASFKKSGPDNPSIVSARQRPKLNWQKILRPSGTETRLGQAIQQTINNQHHKPMAGILVVTDGGHNVGITPETAVQLAKEANIPIHAIGVGSTESQANVRVSDFIVPTRAYPGDRYSVTGFIQSQGLEGHTVTVQLLSRPANNQNLRPQTGTGQLIKSKSVTLGKNGEVGSVKFELKSEEIGRRTLCLRVVPPKIDHDAEDNIREADIEVINRKNRVLLFAGGPTREYRFVRNMLHRDKFTTVDVLLQTARSGVLQDSNKILSEFPNTREEMFKYDSLVAFDPDWQALHQSQIQILESWVAEQGGGLIVIAGPVYVGKSINGWIHSPEMATIRSLYPVKFKHRFAVLNLAERKAETPLPLKFTPEGLRSEFLHIENGLLENQDAWSETVGVFGYVPVEDAKPGATVLAHLSGPLAAVEDKLPVYFADHFYGSGRVFYMGSGETWRLRRENERWFDTLWTKLIRHVSQGRMLRGSARGVLLVGRERHLLGDTVEIRAQLTNAQLEPLSTPIVLMQLVAPDDNTQAIQLHAVPNLAGTYLGHFSVQKEGEYRLELPIPESDHERLTRRIQVKVPNLERESPQRNDILLGQIAENTGGNYYVGFEAAVSGASLASQLKDRTKTTIHTDTPNPLLERTWLRSIMYVICTFLFLEWLIRRLVKLA